jgi:hypothetical protein
MTITPSDPEQPRGRDNDTPSNRNTQPAQGEEGLREDEAREPGSRLDGPGFGKGSNAV